MQKRKEPLLEIRPLQAIDLDTLREIIIGHVTSEVFRVEKTESETAVTFQLTLTALPEPKTYAWQPDEKDLAAYRKAFAQDTCVAAYLGEKVVGVAIADVHEWNRSLWVMEFHVHPEYHRRGIGWLMMEVMVEIAKRKSLRVIVCETQNTNLAAIRFYQAMGFTMDSVDLSYYSNDDYRNNSIAVFMKRKIK
jgi:ribosomal protein S18 acetylase RimI-like enzyme